MSSIHKRSREEDPMEPTKVFLQSPAQGDPLETKTPPLWVRLETKIHPFVDFLTSDQLWGAIASYVDYLEWTLFVNMDKRTRTKFHQNTAVWQHVQSITLPMDNMFRDEYIQSLPLQLWIPRLHVPRFESSTIVTFILYRCMSFLRALQLTCRSSFRNEIPFELLMATLPCMTKLEDITLDIHANPTDGCSLQALFNCIPSHVKIIEIVIHVDVQCFPRIYIPKKDADVISTFKDAYTKLCHLDRFTRLESLSLNFVAAFENLPHIECIANVFQIPTLKKLDLFCMAPDFTPCPTFHPDQPLQMTLVETHLRTSASMKNIQIIAIEAYGLPTMFETFARLLEGFALPQLHTLCLQTGIAGRAHILPDTLATMITPFKTQLQSFWTSLRDRNQRCCAHPEEARSPLRHLNIQSEDSLCICPASGQVVGLYSLAIWVDSRVDYKEDYFKWVPWVEHNIQFCVDPTGLQHLIPLLSWAMDRKLQKFNLYIPSFDWTGFYSHPNLGVLVKLLPYLHMLSFTPCPSLNHTAFRERRFPQKISTSPVTIHRNELFFRELGQQYQHKPPLSNSPLESPHRITIQMSGIWTPTLHTLVQQPFLEQVILI